jgi:hypothetical protein
MGVGTMLRLFMWQWTQVCSGQWKLEQDVGDRMVRKMRLCHSWQVADASRRHNAHNAHITKWNGRQLQHCLCKINIYLLNIIFALNLMFC